MPKKSNTGPVGGNVKAWQMVDVVKYAPAERAKNLEFMLDILPTLIMLPQKSISRRNRPDPRELPFGTPFCFADHSWHLFGAGTRQALNLPMGVLQKVLTENDNGASGLRLQTLLRDELRDLTKLRQSSASVTLPVGTKPPKEHAAMQRKVDDTISDASGVEEFGYGGPLPDWSHAQQLAKLRKHKTSRVTTNTDGLVAFWAAFNAQTAQADLDRKQHNRKLKLDKLAALGRIVENEGEWDGENGETVQYDIYGRLINGDHRLTAISKCTDPDKKFVLLVVLNVPPKSRKTIDQNCAARTLGHQAEMFGFKGYGNEMSAAAHQLWAYGMGQRGQSTTVSTNDLEAIYKHHPLLFGIVKSTKRSHKSKAVRRGLVAALACIVATYGNNRAKAKLPAFLEAIQSGNDEGNEAPAKYHAWIYARIKKPSSEVKWHNLIKAWNLYYSNEDVKGKWLDSGADVEIDGIPPDSIILGMDAR